MSNRRRTTAALAAAALSATLVLGACSAPRSSGVPEDNAPQATTQPQTTQGGQPDVQERKPGADPSAPTTQQQKLVKTGKIVLKVDDVDGAAASIRGMLTTYDAQVSGENIGTGASGREYGVITLRIPADKTDAAMAALEKVGEVITRTVTTEDVTSSYIDMEARIKSLEASVARLRALVAKATDVNQIANLEKELSNREADLDSLKAQHNALKDKVALSTVTVELSTNPPAPKAPEQPGFMSGLRSGWANVTSFFSDLAVFAGWLLPMLIPIALFGIPLVLLARWAMRRAKAARGARPQAPAPVTVQPTQPVRPTVTRTQPVPPQPVKPTKPGQPPQPTESSAAPRPPQGS